MRSRQVISIVALCCVFSVLCSIIAVQAFSQTPVTDWNKVGFATTSATVRFFDPATQKVYVYSETHGSLERVWKIKELGEPLIKE